jgi:transcription elongation factor
VGVLSRLAQALGGVSVFRRGAVSPFLFAALAGAPVRACDDGGTVAAAAALAPAANARGYARPGADEGDRRAEWQAQAAAELGASGLERLEARAFVAAADFIEALGAENSAVALGRALEARLSEDRG